MHESSTSVFTINMVSSFLPAFCVLLFVGAAIAGGDDMPEEMKKKMKEISDACVAEGYEAPTKMTAEVDPEFACFEKCVFEHLHMLKDGKVTLPEKMPNHAEIMKCIEEEKTTDDGCEIASVTKTCMGKFRPS